MSRAVRLFVGVIASGAMALAISVQAQDAKDAPKPDTKWRIPCSGYSTSAGTVKFLVSQPESPDIEITANVPKGHSENQIAKDVRDGFRAALPKDRFSVETDDGEDVLVKAKGDQKKYVVTFVSLSVQGIAITLRHD
jgi:hypothetical protein